MQQETPGKQDDVNYLKMSVIRQQNHGVLLWILIPV